MEGEDEAEKHDYWELPEIAFGLSKFSFPSAHSQPLTQCFCDPNHSCKGGESTHQPLQGYRQAGSGISSIRDISCCNNRSTGGSICEISDTGDISCCDNIKQRSTGSTQGANTAQRAHTAQWAHTANTGISTGSAGSTHHPSGRSWLLQCQSLQSCR